MEPASTLKGSSAHDGVEELLHSLVHEDLHEELSPNAFKELFGAFKDTASSRPRKPDRVSVVNDPIPNQSEYHTHRDNPPVTNRRRDRPDDIPASGHRLREDLLEVHQIHVGAKHRV